MSDLVSTEWLAGHLADPKIRVVDASWYLPQARRDAKAEYEAGHIPGAVFADIDALSDHTSPWPHMLPPPAEFARGIGALGIGDDTMVVVYDGVGINAGARVWWMLHAMGHDQTAMLDGGLPKWKREGRPLDTGHVTPVPATFTARPNPAIVRSFEDMLQNLKTRAAQVIDARGAPRFYAREPEPRPGVRGGHIPGSINIPYPSFAAADGTFKSADALRQLFADKGVDLAQPVVTSCGSGVTAAILFLGLKLAGARQIALYDGSWSEWGARPEAPVETD